MAYKVTLVGAAAHEQMPAIALYSLDALGRISGKITVVSNGELNLAERRADIVALGPDVENPASLDPAGLVTLRLADQLPQWDKTGEILIPSQWWRGWLGLTICVSGNAYHCRPIVIDPLVARAVGLGLRQPIFPESCQPLCNGVVEVWESTTCCWPFPILEVPRLIDSLAAFLAANPIMFPVPPLPDPGPVEQGLAARVDAAVGAGKVSTSFVPSSTLAQQLSTLRRLSPQDAVTYIENYPSLWRFWPRCDSSSALLGETALNPDGSFSYCYRYYPYFRFNCRSSYFYKVKQLINGVWTYVYDGAAANQYFAADETADLYTQSGVTCFQPPALPGNDFVALSSIGFTSTGNLYSNWLGATLSSPGVEVDQTQVGDTAMAPLVQNAGLTIDNGAPWATTLSLLLTYDSALQSDDPSPYYYRMSVVQADQTGNPMSGAATVVLSTPISWQYFDAAFNIQSQPLGPVTVGGNQGLYQIPYFGGSNPTWIGDQFHQVLDTTQLLNVISGGPGNQNGQFLLIIEVFDQTGVRLVPQDATSPLPSDNVGTFSYVRLLNATDTAHVQWNSLTHVLWVDNRPVVGSFDYYQDPAGTQVCQFLTGNAADSFSVGYHAYHTVMCDYRGAALQGPPPPSETFLWWYNMTWEKGLNGGSGTLVSASEVNAPAICPEPGTTSAVATSTFGTLLGSDTACSFALTLTLQPKHTNGFGTLSASSWPAAVALSLPAPPCPPCPPIRLD